MAETIIPFESSQLEELLKLTIRAWEPVFPLMQSEMPGYVFESFYPHGWEDRQRADITTMCQDAETSVWVSVENKTLTGYVGLREHPEDSMGEVYVIAVDPQYQRQGIGAALLNFSFSWMTERGLKMAMVETGGDAGHSPSRNTYEQAGFERLPVARYFREL